jgi:hypothetical protein
VGEGMGEECVCPCRSADEVLGSRPDGGGGGGAVGAAYRLPA